MSHQFLKLSGILSLIGGLSLGVYQLLHPGRDAHSVLNSPYSLIHDMGLLSIALLLFGITWLMFIIGHVWFARNLTSSGSYPKLAAILIMLGAPLFGGQLLVPLWIETLGGLLLGLGYAWVGSLLKTRIPV